jgi:hypothetical protein
VAGVEAGEERGEKGEERGSEEGFQGLVRVHQVIQSNVFIRLSITVCHHFP